MRTRQRLAILTTTICVALLATGCQSSSAKSASTPAIPATATAAPSGPLDQYTMEVQSIYGDTDKTWNEQQEKIATCMAAQGFQYKPVPYSSPSPEIAKAEAAQQAMKQPSYYTKYGYGLFTNPPFDGGMASPPAVVDPNQKMTDAMSGPELAAYQTALNGSGGMPAGSAPRQKGDTLTKWKYQGCTGQAEHAVMGGPGSEEDPAYESLRKAMVQENEDQSNAPDIAKAESDWSGCMTKAGYSGLKTTGDAVTYVQDNAAKGNRNQSQKADFEVKVAKADFGCQDKVHLNDRIQKAEFAVQQQFVDQHKSELDAWVAAAKKYAGDNGLDSSK